RLGVAIGVFQKLKQLGVETKLRFTAMKETIDVVKKLSTGESVSYEGKFVRLNGLKFPWAKPFPVYVAGSSQRSLQLAGQIADGAIVAHFPPSYAKWAMDEMSTAAENGGRDRKEVELLVQEMTVMMSDREEALSRAKKITIDPFRPRTVLFYLGPALWASKESRVLERSGFDPSEIDAIYREEEYLNRFEEGKGDPSRLDSAIPPPLEDKICKTLAMVGNSNDCLEKIKGYDEAGVSEFMPGFWGYETRDESTIKGLEDYKREIIPEFSH
ncbi:MAG: LLM class flavin-dependent oxidoreductase, partial [Nitrososphaerales archaeon]